MPIKIVSGGQTGADRAALDWAIDHAIPHGGWCPRGRRAEDGAIPARYLLSETPSERYEERTEWNVRDSDGTVILSLSDSLTGGSRFTAERARALGKPCLHVSQQSDGAAAAEALRRFVALYYLTGFLKREFGRGSPPLDPSWRADCTIEPGRWLQAHPAGVDISFRSGTFPPNPYGTLTAWAALRRLMAAVVKYGL